jgi:hypothetical protein
VLRSYMRQRENLVTAVGTSIQHMQKLALHKHARIQASRAEIARSLEGTWRPELLFVLEQSLELYDTYLEKIKECDRRIEEYLKTMEAKVDPAQPAPEPRRMR